MEIRKLVPYSLIFIICLACDTGHLTVISNLPGSLDEVSGNEIVANSELYWVLEDGNNEPRVFGLDSTGTIVHSVLVKNSENNDWEDLAADEQGNLYIGDFGNNRRQRVDYQIYKIENKDLFAEAAVAKKINFVLPKGMDQQDFEALIFKEDQLYVFSKENTNFKTFKIPSSPGNHVAEFMYSFNLDGKGNKITSADISANGQTLILLNHNKLWELSDFNKDDFFSGTIKAYYFKHSSQKEGLCFADENTVIISDESRGMGGNMYRFNLTLEQ